MVSSSGVMEEALIPNEKIKLYEQLGEGSFAVVKRGTWAQDNGKLVDVAAKILRDSSPNIMDDLRVEASHLLSLRHPSLIHLYGIVRQPATMVFELCEGGSLRDWLRDDEKPIPLVSSLLDYCLQIADALQYLVSKRRVHADVSARNVLLDKDEKRVKLCDFGLMQELRGKKRTFTMAPEKDFPMKWCPPEALLNYEFSHASDVWSFGVTIWELFTFGDAPWYGYPPCELYTSIEAGERLKKPKYCSEKIYQIMKNCWEFNPAERCKIGAIREDLMESMFLDATAKVTYHDSVRQQTLQLVKGDEVVVVENTGQHWYGQNKRTQQFGIFPRTVVNAQVLKPRRLLSTLIFGKKGAPRNFKLVDPTRNRKAACRNLAVECDSNTEYDDFDRASDDGFSPSKIELPRAFGSGNDSVISNGSSSFRAEDLTDFIEAPKPKEPSFDIRGNVLEPTPIEKVQVPVAKPASQPVPQSAPQPVRNPSPPVVNNRQSVITDKKPNMPSQSTNVPLFNITSSGSIYPQLNSYPNYGNGYQPYDYGMQYNPGYSGYTGYNPYTSGMGQLALTNSAVNSLPPLVPSENRHSGTAQQLDDAAIMELLGSQNRQPPAHPASQPAPVQTSQAQAAPTASSSTQSSSRSNDLSMNDRMEVLYKEADFTDSGNCDTMVMHCKGDTELALKLLKQNHLVQIGLASDTNKARQALESRQYDLTAAANLLLG